MRFKTLCIPLFFILLIGLSFTNCSKDSNSPPTGPQSLTLSSLTPSTGPPGTEITFTLGGSFSAMESLKVVFDTLAMPVFPKDDGTFTTYAPLLNPGTVSVKALDKSTSIVSQSLSFTVQQLPSTGLPPGTITAEVDSGINIMIADITTFFIPMLRDSGFFTTEYSQALLQSFQQAQLLLTAGFDSLNQLSLEDKSNLDAVLLSSGLYGLFQQDFLTYQQMKQNNKSNEASDDVPNYSVSHACVSLDLVSAMISYLKTGTLAAGIILAPFTGGVSFGAAGIISASMAAMKYITDVYISTDLHSVTVDGGNTVNINTGQTKELKIMGHFEPQSPMFTTYWSTLFSILSSLYAWPPLESWLEGICFNLGINIYSNLSPYGISYVAAHVDARVDPVVYNGGIPSLVTLVNGSGVPLLLNALVVQTILQVTGGSVIYQAQNQAIASFTPSNTSVTGISPGNTIFQYGGYYFAGSSASGPGVINNLLLKCDQIHFLASDKIAPCTFHVTLSDLEVMIYLDGWYDYRGENNHGPSYITEREISWNEYLNSTGEWGTWPYSTLVGQYGSAAYSENLGWQVNNRGLVSYGHYSLGSKSYYSAAKLLYFVQLPPTEYFPFTMQVIIGDELAGEQLLTPPFSYYLPIVTPLIFNSVAVGDNIVIKFTSTNFKNENPVPLVPISDFMVIDESVRIEAGIRLVLE